MTFHAHAPAQPVAPKREPPAIAPANPMDGTVVLQDRQARRVREWLLLLLRFAITRDPKDEAAALAIADEIDALGLSWRPSAPSFFRRTSREVCKAIIALDDPTRARILKTHIARIEDPRLRRAFRAAVDSEENRRSPSLNRDPRNAH
jgi:hypothetical protein